jgi:pyruvate dehydrogenase E1 component
VGDLAWAAGDMRARGFLVGGTSGRTTLNGEGLQHEDGHSHLVASTIPNCVAYDPAYAYELAVIVQDGLRRMFVEQEDVYYYLTVMNENWTHPALPQGAEASILRGIYRLRAAPEGKGPRVRLLGSGAILREVLAAADWLLEVEGVRSDVYSVTSFTELRRDGLSCERWNALHPEPAPPPGGHAAAPAAPRTPWVTECLSSGQGPIVAASDYMKLHADQIRPFLQNGRFRALGTDGFGRSDYRKQLRAFFEVDRRHVAFHALSLLADEGAIPKSRVLAAMAKLGIDPEKIDPVRA